MFTPLKLSSPATRECWRVPVLHEDEHLLALDKPAGLRLLPHPEEPEAPSLMGLLHRAIHEQKPWVRERGFDFLRPTHRLEPETSGVLLLARSRSALAALGNQLHDERPRRLFLALAHGAPEESAFQVQVRMAPRPRQPHLMRIDPRRGRKSLTHFTVRERFARHALWECRPTTERPHQIRLHLRYHQLPVVSDADYGGPPLLLSELKPGYRFKKDAPEKPLIDRPAVHCAALEIEHPAHGAPLRLEAPLPKDFQIALKYLRRFTPAPPPPAFPGETDLS